MQEQLATIASDVERQLRVRGFWWTLRRHALLAWRKLLRVRATPHEIALGCAVGVFAACTPFLGLQMLLAAVIANMLRVNIAAALIGTFVGNPFSWPAIWGASYVAGIWVLGVDPAHAADSIVHSANALGETLKDPTSANVDAAVVNLSPLFLPMIVGGTVVGLIGAVASYYPTWRAVSLFQKRRATA